MKKHRSLPKLIGHFLTMPFLFFSFAFMFVTPHTGLYAQRKVVKQGNTTPSKVSKSKELSAEQLAIIAINYYYGKDGYSQDYYECVQNARKGAELGNADAQTILALCLESGYGVDQNKYEACSWYRKAAEQGNAKAQYHLGVCYNSGRGVPQDYNESVKWYRKAAEQGDDDAMEALKRIRRL